MNLIVIFLIVFLVFFGIYIIYTSYSFQILIHQRKLKYSFVKKFLQRVQGLYWSKGFFGSCHNVISSSEHHSLSNKQKANFSDCYHIIRFKTQNAHWDVFFHLVKEHLKYSELLSIRVFPNHNKIHSEGSVEKYYSKLNIFANNRYLSNVLNGDEIKGDLEWLLRHNGDILLISHNNIHFKAFVKNRPFSVQRVIDMIKAMDNLQKKVFRKGIIEY